MLKKLTAAFLFCFISTVANAQTFQTNRTMLCDKATAIFKIARDYNELPVWHGKNDKGLITVLVVNTSTGSWTLIVTDGEFACVLDIGNGFTTEKQPEQPKSN